ncbi:MAG: hypothetical protein ACNS60_04965 [Candidatus Cyclobacteriaceae bacterium M2_1C_046]
MTKFYIKLKAFMLIIGLLLAGNTLMAQSSLTIDASQAYTSFDFTDSQGNEQDIYDGNFSGFYSIGYQYEDGFIIRGNIGMRNAGATTVIDETNYSWDFQYADVKLGLGYMFGEGRFRPYLVISPYYAFLLKATQTINNEDFDIKDLNVVENNDYGIFASPGVQLTLSDFISAYTQFNYMRGLQNLEGEDSAQESHNIGYSLSLGLSFSIK